MKKKKTVKKHRFRSFLVILLFLYLIATFVYYCFSVPVKNIYILGNNYLSDADIIELADLKKYPSLTKVHSSKIEKKLKSLDIVNDAKVSKSLFGKITIKIEENDPLFIYRSDSKVYLSDGTTTVDGGVYLGIPYLVNYTPKEILQEFIKKFKNIDSDVISLISEIYYDPEIKDEISIDDGRFLFKMNDGNIVYVNIINLKRFNNYKKIFATIDENLRGVLYLNSNRDNVSFTSFDTINMGVNNETED